MSAPEPDADSGPFWAALREDRLSLQRCGACDRYRFPPIGRCPYCRCPDARWEALSGRATVYAWTVVHRAFDPAFADQVPYTVATVDLAEGPRMAVRFEGEPVPDGPARAAFVHHTDWTELRMVPDA